MEHPSTWSVQRVNNSSTKITRIKEIKKKKKNDWFRITANQSNKVLKKNNLRSGMNLSLSSNTYYFSPSKDTTLRNGEQLTKYDHFDDDQTYLANKLEAPQQIVT